MIGRWLLVVVCCLAFAACSSSSGTTNGTPNAGGSRGEGDGKLIISKPAGLIEYDIKDGGETPLITPATANTFVLDPAISPDRARLAFIVQPPPKIEGNRYDAGSDLWVSNRDGAEQRVVLEHVQPNQLIRFPQWEDESNVLAIVQEIGERDGVTLVIYTLERISVDTGAREKVLENVLAFALSPDGAHLAYARLAPQGGEILQGANAGGEDTGVLVGPEQNLTPFQSPRYAPDGAQIAFASADQTQAGLVAESELVSAAPLSLPRRPVLDGLPQDIWTIPADGGTAIRVADLKEDLPALTWSGDGEHIYVLGAAGLYDVSIESGAITRLGDGAFHGQLVWTP